MRYIDINKLNKALPNLKEDFQSKKPFKYIVINDFLSSEICELLHAAYPQVDRGNWDGTTYIDQKNKFTKRTFDPGSLLDAICKEFNSMDFLSWLQALTGIKEELIGDEEFFGGGLHQSINGAFLNIHIDYNFHPKTKFHRRLNAILYMNKEWKDEYEGHLEFWDLAEGRSEMLEKISPSFNRMVIFETNEISFHGHPTPLKTPKEVSRKSLAFYYYTQTRDETVATSDHNTIYFNTQGFRGQQKRFMSGIKAFKERLIKKVL